MSRRAVVCIAICVAVAAFAVCPLAAQSPKFDVASIKACAGGDVAPAEKSGGANASLSPGTLRIDCRTVMDLIEQAFVLFKDGHVNPRLRVPIEGGPSWIHSESYEIDAKADSARTQGMMHGPMLQALLAERFNLKIHRETREVPAYAVTVVKGGIKLHRFQPGSCVPLDLTIFEQFPPPPFPALPKGQTYCGGIDPSDGSRWVAATASDKGPNFTIEARAMSIDDFLKHALAQHLDRPVVNHTGVDGLFDFHLEYAPDETMPDFRKMAPVPPGPAEPGQSIFAALPQQLGLKLEPAKAPATVIVIDQVERPSGN